MSLDQLSDVTISSNCLPSLNILSRQIVIGLPFLKPLKKYGTKLSVAGGGGGGGGGGLLSMLRSDWLSYY